MQIYTLIWKALDELRRNAHYSFTRLLTNVDGIIYLINPLSPLPLQCVRVGWGGGGGGGGGGRRGGEAGWAGGGGGLCGIWQYIGTKITSTL